MDKQEIFNTVYNGLANQGFKKSSPDGNSCRYRYGSLKCAAGWLVPDKDYKIEWDEPVGIQSTTVYNIDWFKSRFGEEELNFLAKLQRAHDDSVSPENMKENLVFVAEINYLEVPEL